MKIPKVEVKKILYATDLSENAHHAFAYAVSLANLYGAGIALLHVLPEVPEIVDSHVIGYISAKRWEKIKAKHFEEAREALTGKKKDRKAIREVLGQFSEDTKAGHEDQSFITEEIIVKRGHPVEEIIKQAEKGNCDIIVMGTHGHGILEDAMIGSTAQRVIRRSQKPVLVVRLPKTN